MDAPRVARGHRIAVGVHGDALQDVGVKWHRPFGRRDRNPHLIDEGLLIAAHHAVGHYGAVD